MSGRWFPWQDDARRNGLVVDTGVLLFRAFGSCADGRYLHPVAADVPPDKMYLLFDHVDQLFRGFRVVLTPQVIAEFQGLAQSRGAPSEHALADFLFQYSAFHTHEEYVRITDIKRAKSRLNAWEFSYVDTWVLLAAERRGSPVLTMDRHLRKLGKSLGVRVLHVCEDYHLHLDAV